MVDDNEPFRKFVASMLRDRKNLNVIGEAGDGLEAVRRAQALQPDLILLDIGLPDLNGLDAARQISKLAPNARIIFLTQESVSEVVSEALSLGAWGYVAKVQAGRELLVAVEMVMQGQRFVSSSLNGHKYPTGFSSCIRVPSQRVLASHWLACPRCSSTNSQPNSLEIKPQCQLSARELTAVMLMTPKVGNVKLESGSANCGWFSAL